MAEMSNEQIIADRQESTGFGDPDEKVAETTEKVEDVKEEVVDSQDTETEGEETTEETIDDTEDLEGTVEKQSEETEEESDTEDIVEKITKKEKISGEQKRINKLTAEKYRLEAELALLKEQKQEQPKQEKRYSDAQLNQAEQKAIADNDIGLLAEVSKERMKNMRADLVKQYEADKSKVLETQTAKQKQWTSIVSRYSDDSDPSMDIRNTKGDLYRVAKAYFEDPALSKEYSGPNGMMRAVADAFLELSRTRHTQKKKSPKEKSLERKLQKEKRKSSLGKPSHDKQAKVQQKKQSNSTMDYINERNAIANKAKGQIR